MLATVPTLRSCLIIKSPPLSPLSIYSALCVLRPVRAGWTPRTVVKIVSIAQAEKRGKRAAESRVLESTPERPDYNRVIEVVKAAAREAQRGGA